MDTHITGTGLTVTPQIRAYFDKHKKKIDKLVHDKAARLDVEFVHLSERQTDNEFRVELMLKAPATNLRSEASAVSLYAAIDEAIEQLLVELRKKKGKKLRLFRLEGLKFKNLLRFGRWKL